LKARPVVARGQAELDIDAAIDYYLSEDAADAAMRFIDALEQAYKHISLHAATGSPRNGHELGLPGLRSWPLTRFPYLVFYLDSADHIDVWRVLHTSRDIPKRMREHDGD
jgi:toxin ParE1/3/4